MIRNIYFLDENDKLLQKEEQILKLDNLDVLGEDYFVYDRENTYSAKVISLDVTLYEIDMKKFMHKFPSAIHTIRD